MRQTSTIESVGSGGTNLMQMTLPEGFLRNGILDCTVVNSGANPLTQFIVQCQSNPDSSPYNYLGNADFADTTNLNLIFVTTNLPHTLAAGQSASFKIRVGACSAIYFWAASTLGTLVQVFAEVN